MIGVVALKPGRVFHRGRTILAGLSLAVALVGQPASALVINATFDSSVNATAEGPLIEAAFNAVAADYEQAFANRVTINVEVSWNSLDGQPLPSDTVGASNVYLYEYYSYAQVKGLLVQSANLNPSDTALSTAARSLPTVAPAGVGRFAIPSSEAKVLGLVHGDQTALDGAIGFSGSPSDYTFSGSGPIAPGTYDFQAVAAHEIAEVLGRISGIDGPAASYLTPFDLYRYSAPGSLSESNTAGAYFSINGGRTRLAAFNVDPSGGDRGDWLTLASSNDIQDAFVSMGEQLNLTAVDLTALDALGWSGSNPGDTELSYPTLAVYRLSKPSPAGVPEAPTWLTMIAGLGLAGARIRNLRGRRTHALTR